MKTLSLGIAVFVMACGGSTRSDGASAAGGAGGSTGGTGAAGATGGGGSGGAAGSSGGAGTGGATAPCEGLSYCDCSAQGATCQVFAEACFCPCGIEPCEPPCACACGGGEYLGCGPKSMQVPGAIDGTWLIGWSGGMNHYSWIRFNGDLTFDVLDGADLSGNAPLWSCSGAGKYLPTAKLDTFFLHLPAPCAGVAITFEKLGPPSSVYVKGSVLTASISSDGVQPLEGYKFGSSQCNLAMTSCKDPF